MFGTVARMNVKPGMEPKIQELMKEYEALDIPGFITTYVYRTTDDPNEFYLATVFQDRETYFANANSPEQDARYRKLMECLSGEPEWHDGDIVYSHAGQRSRMMGR